MKVIGLNRIARSDKYNPGLGYLGQMLANGLDHIVVVVSATLDQKDTASEIRSLYPADLVSVVESGRWTTLFKTADQPGSWALALNDGLDFIATHLEHDADTALLPFSDTAHLSAETIRKMKEALSDSWVSCVGVRFPEFTAVSYQHPRNTGCLWRLAQVLKFGGFAHICDHFGGQEDYELLHRMYYHGGRHVMVDAGEGELATTPMRAQSDKEAMELEAIMQIDEYHERLFGPAPAKILVTV